METLSVRDASVSQERLIRFFRVGIETKMTTTSAKRELVVVVGKEADVPQLPSRNSQTMDARNFHATQFPSQSCHAASGK